MFDLVQQTNTSYILPEFCLLGFPTYVSAAKHMYKDRDHHIDSYWQFSTSPLNSAFCSYVWRDRSQAFLLQKPCNSLLKLTWIIHILHCTPPRYTFAIDSECNIFVTHFSTALIETWVFTKSHFLKISAKQLSLFWRTKREGHKIICRLFHSNVLYFRTFIFNKTNENIVKHLRRFPLQFTLTIEDALVCIDYLFVFFIYIYIYIYTQIVLKNSYCC